MLFFARVGNSAILACAILAAQELRRNEKPGLARGPVLPTKGAELRVTYEILK